VTERPQADDQLADQRTEPPVAGDEKATLTGFLDYHRATLLLKCAGLTPRQLIIRSCPPSSLSLLGLVRHLSQVETGWLRARFVGEDESDFYGPGDADFEVTHADEQSVAAAFSHYTEVVSRSRAIVAGAQLHTMTARAHPRTGEHFSLRWILVHLVEEYARHNGHADLLREAIDGATGE